MVNGKSKFMLGLSKGLEADRFGFKSHLYCFTDHVTGNKF